MPSKLKQGSLLHDPKELLLVHLSITISVCLINHFLHQALILINTANIVILPCPVATVVISALLCTKSGRHTRLQFFVSHVFPKLFGHALQVFEADLASLIIIKQPEGLQDLLL